MVEYLFLPHQRLDGKHMISRQAFLGFVALLGSALNVATAADAPKWVEGRHYALIQPAQPSQAAPGKVEVTEVFSYGCPACFQFQGTMDKIKAGLPANAQLVLLHASWNASESWPLFQRAYLTAQTLNLAEKNHAAMFTAIWAPNGPLAVVDSQTQRLRSPQPKIEDVAKFYAQKGGVTEAQFLQTAKSFSLDMRMKQSDARVKAFQTPATPTLVVAGKYRIENGMVNGASEFVDLIRFLVQKESGGR